MSNFSIKKVETMEEIEGIVNVQRQAWNMDDIGIVPNFETKAVSDVGFVFIAQDEQGDVIGFIYGYHHFPDIHYSHMMAILPEWQDKGVGYALKQYHRDQALQSEHYVRAVQWTVDPLLPNNAYLNFAKLGGFCDTYKVNYYGNPDKDGVEIYAGVPTDRFLVTWPINSSRVETRMQNYKSERVTIDVLLDRSPSINKIVDNKFVGQPEVEKKINDKFTVEVPSNYQEIRRNAMDVAVKWRYKFRDICLKYFKKGFMAYDYHSILEDTRRINYYEFVKKSI